MNTIKRNKKGQAGRSSNDVMIRVEGVSKKFSRTTKHIMLYGGMDIMRDFLGVRNKTHELRPGEFWALEDVSFELKRGETLGVIGQNGSGKSTLLSILSGIYLPDKGRVEVKGRVAPLIQVGAGFHPMLTGRENIYINGQILGMTKKEIDEKFDSIVEFAEIGEFLDSPVKHYSSGMYVRLGFAIAVHCDPDILLVDEVLAVGDVNFRAKCYNKIGELLKKDVSIILVSHDVLLVSIFCKNIVVLEKGRKKYHGSFNQGIGYYYAHNRFSNKNINRFEKVIEGTDYFKILNVNFLPRLNSNEIKINSGEKLIINIYYNSDKVIEDIDIILSISLPDCPSKPFFQKSSKLNNKRINILKGQGIININLQKMNVNTTDAYLNISIWEKNKSRMIFWWKNIPLYIQGDTISGGISDLNIKYKIL